MNTLNTKPAIQNLEKIDAMPFSALADHYDYFLIDLVGVIHDGINAFPKAINAVNQLIGLGKKVIFLSNTPRPSSLSKEKLIEMGILEGFDVVTSGDAARDTLTTTYAGMKVFHLGEVRNKDISQGLCLNIIESFDDCDVVLLTLFLEPHENPNEYDVLLSKIAASGKPVLCANPDKYAFFGKEIRRCAGYFAQKLIQMNGNVKILGKPDISIYQYIGERYPEVLNDKSKVLAIGDTLETDVLGGKNFGIHALLVLSGITAKNMAEQGLNAQNLQAYCANGGHVLPNYCNYELDW